MIFPSRILIRVSGCKIGWRSPILTASRRLIATNKEVLPIFTEDKGGCILKSPRPDLQLDEANFADFVLHSPNRQRSDEDVAMECGMTGEQTTYGDIERSVKAYARGFLELGLKQGDVAMVSLLNGSIFPKVVYGLMFIGVTVCPVPAMATPDEIRYIVQSVKPKVIIAQDLFLPNVLQAVGDFDDINVLVPGLLKKENKIVPLESIINNRSDCHITRQNFDCKATTALLPFSSGTTGSPKGVMLSHYNLTSSLEMIYKNHEDLIPSIRKGGSLGVVPFSHIFGFLYLQSASLYSGFKIFTLPLFDWDLFLNILKDKRPSCVSLVPSLVERLAFDPKVTPDLLESIDIAMCGGSPISQSVLDAFTKKMRSNAAFGQGYALTESPVLARQVNAGANVAGTLEPNVKVKIVDPNTTRTLPPNSVGEICTTGPQVMQGYFQNDASNKEAFLDGWLRTGDLGFIAEDGILHFVDRLKDLIKVKGLQVSPAELEDVICQVDGVANAVVVGIPDDQCGEVPKAFVLKREDSNVSVDQINDHVNKSLSSHKRLRGGVTFVDVLPIHPSGKKMRRVLRQQQQQQQKQQQEMET